MPTSPIAFVIFKIIDRIHPVIGTHDPVSIDLGHHTGRGKFYGAIIGTVLASLVGSGALSSGMNQGTAEEAARGLFGFHQREEIQAADSGPKPPVAWPQERPSKC